MARRNKARRLTTSDLAGDLWPIVTKIRGLAALFRTSNGEIPIDEEAFHGISHILSDIADDLDRVRDVTEYGPE